MGWSGGSGIAADIWDLVRAYVPSAERRRIAAAIVDIFEHEDCDTMRDTGALWEDATGPEASCCEAQRLAGRHWHDENCAERPRDDADTDGDFCPTHGLPGACPICEAP